MSTNEQLIQSEIRRVQNVRLQGRTAWICCPFHHEKTPSCRVDLKRGKYPAGSFYCYGCAEHGDWNMLAEKLNLRLLDGKKGDFETFYDAEYLNKLRNKLLETDKVAKFGKRVGDEVTDWRSIPAWILRELGSTYVKPSKTTFLQMPVYVNGDHITDINARLKKSKNKKFSSYVMSSAVASKETAIFPYDYVKSMLKRSKTRKGRRVQYHSICLVEGPRDALRLLSMGIPALALLGTNNWGDKKARLLKILCVLYDVDIIVMMDGDKPGDEARKKIIKTFKKLKIPYQQIKMLKWAAKYGRESLDPMDAPLSFVKRVRRLVRTLK